MIKTLSRSLREYNKGSVLTILLSILEAAFEITIPLCMAKVIDEGIDLGNMNAVWKYGIILLVFALFQLITGVLSAHIAARTSVGFCAKLRQDMYDNVQTFAFSNIDKFSTASIVTRLTTDVTNIQNLRYHGSSENELFSGTIKENLRWGNENATDEEIKHACHLACADGFIEAMPKQYDTYIEQGGNNVSGGQKQRLCIARALLKNPKVLILDDSTSTVDTKTDAAIQRAFAEYIPDTTKIIIAQRVSSVQNADKIVVLNDGKIDAVGTHEELLKNCNIYREVYRSQVKGDGENE